VVAGVSGSVQSAKLRLYVLGGANDGPAAYTSGTSWSETGITWNNRPARTSAALDQLGAVADNSWIEFDVTAAVAGNGTYSFDLAVSSSSSGVLMSSREGVQPPQLVVTTGAAAAPPAAPSSLAATAAASGSQVSLTWADNASNEDGFKLYRLTENGWMWFATAGANATVYSWTGAAPGTSYSFQVTAYDAAGESAPSNNAAATTPALPVAPSNLAATAVSGSRIDLTWADNSTNEDGFKLYRSTDGINWVWFATAGANATAYTWTGASPASTYYFRVTAYNAMGDSDPSNTASLVTPAA
jgi:fibronectin type 3 domain-containing protein